MAEHKHTPKPWKICGGLAGTYEIQFGDDGECVAEIVHEKPDAVLMIAAPYMLEALENALLIVLMGKPRREERHVVIDQIRAAIEKATERKG